MSKKIICWFKAKEKLHLKIIVIYSSISLVLLKNNMHKYHVRKNLHRDPLYTIISKNTSLYIFCALFHDFLFIFFCLLHLYCIFAYSPDDYRVQEQYYKKKYQHDLILWQCSSSLPLPHNIRKIIRNDLGLWFHIISDTWSASHAVNFRYLVKIYWLWVLCRFSAQLHWVVCDRGKILNWKKKRRPIS